MYISIHIYVSIHIYIGVSVMFQSYNTGWVLKLDEPGLEYWNTNSKNC